GATLVCTASWWLTRTVRCRIEVVEFFHGKGCPGGFAAGYIAAQDDPLPQLAQPAEQMGKAVARMIDADVRGKRKIPFEYTNLGTMADRKSTRLNSSHVSISYAVSCLKRKKRQGPQLKTESL